MKELMYQLINLAFAAGFIALFVAVFFSLGGALVELLTKK